MIQRNPFQRLAQDAFARAQRAVSSAGVSQGASGSSGPETASAVGANDPVSGALVLYGLLGVTLAGAGGFRLKNG